MSISRRRLLILALIALPIAVVGFVAYSIVAWSLREPGLYLELKLYNPSNNTIVDETGLLESPDTVVFLFVEAIAPPVHDKDIVVVHKAAYKGSNIIFIPYKKLQDIARGWVETYKSRRGNIKETYSGLIISLYVYDSKTGRILYQLYDSLSYKPVDVAENRSQLYRIHLAKGTPKAAHVEKSYMSYTDIPKLVLKKPATEITSTQASFATSTFSDCVCSYEAEYACTCRKLVFEITPENLTSTLPASYFNNTNGKLYMKTPVLITWNKRSDAGPLNAGIIIAMTDAKVGVYPTLGTGNILSTISRGEIPDVVLWKGSGFTWGGKGYYYGLGYQLDSNEQKWAWIWARPVFRIYEKYWCIFLGISTYCTYIGDSVESFVTDILTSGTTILGGVDNGLPHEAIMTDFYSGTNLTPLKIPETMLADGKLDPGEYVNLRQIFQYFDKCGADFEASIPVGAIAAVAICPALGVSPLGAICLAATAFASAIQVSLSLETPSISIDGYIVNYGSVPVEVYVGVSRYSYHQNPPWWCFWCGPCYYNVTAGVYFESR